ncbi:MAG: nucleotide exchange factor GrpE [Gemmatimonadetes bacterium]|nr:nucleotide exchange factor GrpE [Gemmatimonadota bacterium]MYD12055.1 nucleotide exchange factor GrpE [Gemmatimonadota bacterium]MYI64376.1 nucleotide exchange factor GrpE [Gemmatimonadota bacterium]
MNVPDNEGMQERVREAGSEERAEAPEAEADGDTEARAGEEAPAQEAATRDSRAEASRAEDEARDAGVPADAADGRTPISELEAERDRLRDQHLRLAADFDNFRKRTEDRLRQRWNRAQADLVARFLEPLDDLRRVTALEPESTASVDAIVEGVDLVERKFFRALEEAGVEVVDPEGEGFDPNTMEAMMRVSAESEDDDDTVASVFQRGYTLKGILIRPARVSVFKAD